jgi:hypothetical protein
MLCVIRLSVVILSVIKLNTITLTLTEWHYAECHNVECNFIKFHYAECHNVQCHYSECKNDIILIVRACLTLGHASWTVFTTLRFLCNLQLGTISKSVAMHWAGKACQGHTL